MGDEGLLVIQSETSGAELAQDLMLLRHQIDKQELLFSRLAARFAETDYWEEAGSVSAKRAASREKSSSCLSIWCRRSIRSWASSAPEVSL